MLGDVVCACAVELDEHVVDWVLERSTASVSCKCKHAHEVLFPEISGMYTSIAVMLIDSAAPFSILGIGLVVMSATKVYLMLVRTIKMICFDFITMV